jgi:hypothetical protein
MTRLKDTPALWQGEVASSFDPAAEAVIMPGDCLQTLGNLRKPSLS